MSRLRPRFKRSMFRTPSIGGAKHFPMLRGDVREGFRDWMDAAHEEDPDAFDLALDLEPDFDDDSSEGQHHAEMAQLPPGLRGRVMEMQSRIVASARNFDAALRKTRPARTQARRYRGRR